ITHTGAVDATAFDGFESTTYDGGANWAGDWQEQGDDGLPGAGAIVITDVAPFAGSYSLRLSGDGPSISRAINLEGFISPVLRFVRRGDQLGAGNYFLLEVHDGVRWTPVLTWTAGDLDDTYIQEMVNLDDTTTGIRFSSWNHVGAQGYFYVDQVQVYDGIAISVNQGEAIGKDEYSDTLFNPTDQAAVYINPFNLTKSVNRTQAEIADTLVYTLSYVNPSTFVTATHVTLRDAVPIQYVTFMSASDGGVYHPASGAIVWSLDTLPPGASGNVSFSVRVNDFVEDGTVIENVAHLDSDQAQAGSNRVRTTVLAPEVQLYKSGPALARSGQVITYTLFCENTGGSEATEVLISDVVPRFTSFVPGSLAIDTGSGWVALSDAEDGDQGAFISPTLVIAPGASVGIIAPGEVNRIRFSVQIEPDLSPDSLLLNSATLDRRLDIPRDSNTVVTRISDLLLDKVAEQAVVAPGDVISYTLTYENTSDTIVHTNVYVREPIPSYTSFVAGTAYGADQIEYSWDNGATWSATPPVTPVTHLRWRDADLPVGAQETVGFAVRVNPTLPSNTTIQNTARITSTETLGDKWLSSNRVEVETVDLWVEKRVNRSAAPAGDTLFYSLSYGNHGSADAFGVQIQDTLPPDVTYLAGSIWGMGADDSGAPTLVWDGLTVAAGASAQEVGYAVVLDSDLVLGTIITNTATLSSVYGLEASNVVTVVVANPDITLSPGELAVTLNTGDTTARVLTVGNMGAADLDWSLVESPLVSWLDEAPTGGAVVPQDSEDVTITFNATGLAAGVYATTLQITSNDPDESALDVPVTLTVLAPDIEVHPGALVVTLNTGATAARTLTIDNLGEMDLDWSLAESPPVSWLDEMPIGGTVVPQDSEAVTVTFDATDLVGGVYTTTLQIASNDPDESPLNVPVNLNVLAPDITVSPSTLLVTLKLGDTAMRTLAINNVGELDLSWSLTEQPVQVSWLDETPTSSVVAPQGGEDVIVTFDTADLAARTYTTTLRIESNDPDEPSLDVTVVLIVQAPDIEVSPGALIVSLGVNDRTTRTLTIGNAGEADLTWSLTEVPPAPWLNEMPTSSTVAPQNSEDVAVTFDATDLAVDDVYMTTLRINSDDPNDPLVDVPVILTVLPAPDIQVIPMLLEERLVIGDRATRTLTVSNVGGADLTWNLVVTPTVPWLEEEASMTNTLTSLSSDVVTITFDATDLGEVYTTTHATTYTTTYTTTLQFHSNDPDDPQVDVPVKLQVLHPYPQIYRLYMPLMTLTGLALNLDKQAPDEVYAGSRLEYSLRVENAGNGLVSNLVITDALPAYTEFDGCDNDCVPPSEGYNGVAWHVPELGSGQSWTATWWVTVYEGLTEGDLIVSDGYTVVADSLPPLSGPPVTTRVREPLSISKTAWPDPVMVGQVLTFTIQVTNNGSLLLQGLSVKDELPDHVGSAKCYGVFCEVFTSTNEVAWRIPALPPNSVRELWVRVHVSDTAGITLVNSSYFVLRAGRRVKGQPVEVRVIHPLSNLYYFYASGVARRPWGILPWAFQERVVWTGTAIQARGKRRAIS
ncbi:MAG: hypothetical protein PVF45_01620, partial [Anaerolineae bacterium]